MIDLRDSSDARDVGPNSVGPNSDGPNSDGPNSDRPNSDRPNSDGPDEECVAELTDPNAVFAFDWHETAYETAELRTHGDAWDLYRGEPVTAPPTNGKTVVVTSAGKSSGDAGADELGVRDNSHWSRRYRELRGDRMR